MYTSSPGASPGHTGLSGSISERISGGKWGAQRILVARHPEGYGGLHQNQYPVAALDMALLAKKMDQRVTAMTQFVHLCRDIP